MSEEEARKAIEAAIPGVAAEVGIKGTSVEINVGAEGANPRQLLEDVDTALRKSNVIAPNTRRVSICCFPSVTHWREAKPGEYRVRVSTFPEYISELAGRRPPKGPRVDTGIQSFPPPVAPAEDDGGDDLNPNWPSKTGNPSGGGRGNNPPRR